MKKILILAFAALCSIGVSAQNPSKEYKELLKERKAINKLSKKELNDRATKDARRDARGLEKEGWRYSPGALPVEKQLDRSYLMQFELDENAYPKYIMAEAMALGGNYDAAKMQALELAKVNLAGQIQTEVTGLIENTVANEQLTDDQTVSIINSVASSKNLISQKLGRILPVVELYRDVNGSKELMVRIAYSFDAAKAVVKEAVKQDLESKGEQLHGDIDKMLGL